MVIVDKASAVAHADLVDLHGVTRTKVEMETEEILIIKSINQSINQLYTWLRQPPERTAGVVRPRPFFLNHKFTKKAKSSQLQSQSTGVRFIQKTHHGPIWTPSIFCGGVPILC